MSEEKFIDNEFNKAVLTNLYNSLPRLILSSTVAAGIFTYLLYQVLDPWLCFFWFSTAVLINITRLFFRKNYYNKRSETTDYKKYINQHFVLTSLFSSTWGISLFLLVGKLEGRLELLIMMFLCGMITGGAATNVAQKKQLIVLLLLFLFRFLSVH